jgi:hypothetical protein
MHFGNRVRTWHVARLYNEIALSRKLFGIEHMYIYTFLLRMTDIMTSQNIDVCSHDTLHIYINRNVTTITCSEITPFGVTVETKYPSLTSFVSVLLNISRKSEQYAASAYRV